MKHLRLFPVLLAAMVHLDAAQYIIEFTDAPKAVRSARRAQNQRALELRRAQVVDGTRMTVETLIVDVDDQDLYAIATLPQVKRIHRVATYEPASSVPAAQDLQNIPLAWEKLGGWERAGEGVKIAIIDSGIDPAHPAFHDPAITVAPAGYPRADRVSNLRWTNAKIIVARSYESLNRQYGAAFGTEARDVLGHGTASASLAAGVPHESPLGTLAGVAPRAYLGNYKVLGDASGGSTAGVLKAIDDAVADGMDILNLSLGSGLASRPEEDIIVQAIERAVAQGVIVVVAAGNTGTGLNSISSPGTAPSAITVGSHSSTLDQVSWFSGKGPNMGDGIKPDLLAAGEALYTADSTLRAGSSGYRALTGTSLSTPIVSGFVAVLRAQRPGLTADEYRSLVINSAAPMTTGRVLETGAGRADLARAVDATVTATPAFLRRDGTIRIQGGTGCLATVDGTGLEAWMSDTQLEAHFTGRAEGWVTVSCQDAQPVRIPFWRADTPAEAGGITLLDAPRVAIRNTVIEFGVRVVDAAGVALTVRPLMQVASGSVQVQDFSLLRDVPQTFQVRMRVGAGENVVRFGVGNVEREFRVIGQ